MYHPLYSVLARCGTSSATLRIPPTTLMSGAVLMYPNNQHILASSEADGLQMKGSITYSATLRKKSWLKHCLQLNLDIWVG